MGRPKATDPKRSISVTIRTSTLNVIADRATNAGESLNAYLAARIEATWGKQGDETPEEQREAAASARPKPSQCSHPIGRRIGHTCGACLKTL